MINLLPEQNKIDIKAARANSILVKYFITISFGVAFLALTSWGVYFTLQSLQSTASNVIKKDTTTQSSKNVELQAQIQVADNKINSANNIINQEIKYSTILALLAKVMPSGTVIGKLTLSRNIYSSQSTITFYATNADTAASLKTAIQNTSVNSLFTSVAFQSGSGSGPSTINGYSTPVTALVTFNREFKS